MDKKDRLPRRRTGKIVCAVTGAALLAAAGAVDQASANGLFGGTPNGAYDWSGFYVGGQAGYG
jgi:opacity protein-like surface antigen